MAVAFAALLAPSRPLAAVSLLLGELLATLNFFFLGKLVKLITHSARSGGGHGPLPASFYSILALKLAVVYGAASTLLAWKAVEVPPLAMGLSLPLVSLVLKSIMLAVRPDANRPRRPLLSKGAASLALALLLAAPSIARAVPGPGAPPAHETATTAESGASHEAKGESGEQHLPNWIDILNDYFSNNPVVHWMHENEYLVFAWLAGVAFLGFAWLAMRRPSWVPGQLQNALEWMIESMHDVCEGMLGKYTDRYFPYIIAVFFYILTMNLIGILPGFKSATSTLDVTLALALITFVYVQITGIRNLGILGYLDHLAGSPRDLVGFIMLPVMIPVHVLGELAKPVSLSCRLFGNIFGEDTLIVVFVGATAMLLKASLVALALPPMVIISALFMLLQTLTSIVQALIFALLATVYLYMMLPHEHPESDAEHAHA